MQVDWPVTCSRSATKKVKREDHNKKQAQESYCACLFSNYRQEGLYTY